MLLQLFAHPVSIIQINKKKTNKKKEKSDQFVVKRHMEAATHKMRCDQYSAERSHAGPDIQ